jgi:DNA replication licensing factor MCM4
MAVSDVRRELADMMNVATVIQDELVDAIRRVEADGLIQFNERNQTIFVRAGMI